MSLIYNCKNHINWGILCLLGSGSCLYSTVDQYCFNVRYKTKALVVQAFEVS